jgi:hypothetical protein
MRHGLISGDNHIDLTYCPPDLWSAQAPAKWRLLVPRVEELEDGCHELRDPFRHPGLPFGRVPLLVHRPANIGLYRSLERVLRCQFGTDNCSVKVPAHGDSGPIRAVPSRALAPLNTPPAPAAPGRSAPARHRRHVAHGPRAADRRC